MLSIGEFSNICKVSTKTLRYYAEIGLILPEKINSENGYRYYSIDQLKTMLLINRLKTYQFSLEEIKEIIHNDEQDEKLYIALNRKKELINQQIYDYENTLKQLSNDLSTLKQGYSIMSYLDEIDIQLVDVVKMNIVSIRKTLHKFELPEQYKQCFQQILKQINKEQLTIAAAPMVLFHDSEFSAEGMDIEFAIPVIECSRCTNEFHPGLCLKTTLYGSYQNLTSVYAKQREWVENEGYISSNAVYEVYINDPSQVSSEDELISEIYYPVKKDDSRK